MDADGERRPRRHRRLVTIVVVLVTVLVAGAVYATVRGYQSVSRASGKIDASSLTPDLLLLSDYYFVIVADVGSVSPDAHTASVRLNFGEIDTKYMDGDQVEMRTPLTVSLFGTVTEASTSSTNSFTLNRGIAPMIDVTMALPEGESLRYPFDTYEGELLAIVKTSTGKTVPSVVIARNAADGWTLSKELTHRGTKSFGLALHIGRASDAQLYAVFILALMWALAIAGVVMAWILVRDRRREIGGDILVYLAALLFALPLIRTLLPGNPGLGVLADFVVYFWVEAVVGITLVVLLFVWIERNRPPHQHAHAGPTEADAEAVSAEVDQ
jgi:hypothetical protein